MNPTQPGYPMPRHEIAPGVSVPIAPVTPALEEAVRMGQALPPASLQELGVAGPAPRNATPEQRAQYQAAVEAQRRGEASVAAERASLTPQSPGRNATPEQQAAYHAALARRDEQMSPAAPSAPEQPGEPAAPQRGSLYDPTAGGQSGGPPSPAYPPARWVPGKMQPSSQSTEYGERLSPEGLDTVLDAQVGRKLAAQTTADVQQSQAQAQLEASRLQENNLREENTRMETQRVAREQAVSSVLDRSRQLRAERQQRVAEMGPNRFFRNIGTIPTILAALTRGVGAVAAYMPGGTGTNSAGDVIDDAIDRDMQSQRNEIDALDGDLDASNNELAQMYREYGDPQDAEREFRINAREVAKMKGLQLLQGTEDQAIKAKLQSDLAEIDAGTAQLVSDQDKQIGRRVNEAYQQGHTIGGEPTQAQRIKKKQADKTERELDRELSGGADANDPLLIPGFGRAKTPEDAKVAKDLIAAKNKAIVGLARLEDPDVEYEEARSILYNEVAPGLARTRSGGFNPSADQDTQARADVDALANSWRQKFTSPSSWLRNAEAGRKAMRNSIVRQANEPLRVYIPGYEPEKLEE